MNKKILTCMALCFMMVTTLKVLGQNTDQSKTEFKPSGKVWGYVFGDYFLKVHADSLNRGNVQYSNQAKDFNGFSFRRIYLGYDFQISEKFSTQFLLANENDNADASGERTVFIKAANVRWKDFLPNQDLIIGQSATPLFATNSEGIWGYRNIEKTVADMRKFGSSNDLGIAISGKFNKAGDFGYNVMLANGTSQKPETDKYKKFYYELFAKLMGQKLMLDVSGTAETAGGGKDISVIKGFVAYSSKAIVIGAEYVASTQKKATQNLTDAANPRDVNVTPLGMSFFLHGPIIADKLNYFARYDTYNPDTKYDPNITYAKSPATYKDAFYVLGIDYTPVKNVHIEPNLWNNSYHSMKGDATGKAKSDYDMAPRITFYYIFRP